ncbi:hypothetical protein ACJIZ3_001879 [Penstemon smallii]|uniref:Zinc finger CCCH domain-containing protein 13-like n=1 Tax=Penstemon smallii TaxID=265156 RepID=A0ABD3U4X1_9LAMI
MPRSSRHKSHKQSKHSSKDYSDSEEDVKMKEKSSKDETLVRVKWDSTSGEKRKISSQVREREDLIVHGNGEVSDKYVSSKRRKEKADVGVDRWNGDGEKREDSNRKVEKEMSKAESLRSDSKPKDSSNKSESLRIDSKNKSKRYVSGSADEKKEERLTSMVVDKDEGKSKGESKRKSERDSSGRKEAKNPKDKDRRSEKEKNGGQESKNGGDEAKLEDMAVGKKQATQLRDLSEERQGKHAREITERTVHHELPNSESERQSEKMMHRRKENSTEREKHCSDSKEGGERRLSSRGDCVKDLIYKDDRPKDARHADKNQEEGWRDTSQRNEKYREEADKDNKHWDDKYRDDGEKVARRRDERHREDINGDDGHMDKIHREDGEKDSRRKDDKYRGGTERNGRRRDDKYHEDGDRDIRVKDDQYCEDGDKDIRGVDERYYEDSDRTGRHRDNSYREDGERENRHKDEKYREDIARDVRHKDRKPDYDLPREKRLSDTKCRDEHISRDLSADKSDPKRSRDDAYASDHHSRKLSAYDDSPTRDDRTARSRDDQGRRRTNEKEDYSDFRSRSTKNQRSDAERKSSTNARIDSVTDRGRSISRNADIEHTSSQSRRRSSPTLSSRSSRDHYRAPKQDDSKYRDYNYEERVRHNISSTRDYGGPMGGCDKISTSRSLEKLGQKEDGHLGELSAERHLKPDIRSSPLELVDKSPSSTERRQFTRSDLRRSIDVDESTQKSGGSRDVKDYSGKEGRGNRELAIDALPGDDFSQAADADTLSISSPFTKNNHFSSSSRSLPPPPFRTGVESPSFLGLSEADSRGQASSRNRRHGDANMGRFQGNAWRGVPSWPSPMGNGFLPFPHAPPPVGFHSVMQPFPAPPMFGIRPSMELNHPSPYHMSDADRFSGPGRPMGWHNQVDDSRPSFNSWDASNAVFGDESHMYGRPEWDQSRNLPGDRGWETSGDLWKGPNRTVSLEMSFSERENKSTPSADVGLDGQSIQPPQSEQPRADQQAESTYISQSTKSIEKNDVEAPLISLEETSDVKMSREDDVCLSHVYLSKLDISADLAEPELFDQCTGSTDLDQIMSSNVDDSAILYMEETLEAKVASHKILTYSLVASADDSVFQKAMSLYKRQKGNFRAEDEEQLSVLSELIPKSDQDDVEDYKTENLCPVGSMQVVEDALPNLDIEVDPQSSLQKMEVYVETKIDTTAKSEAIDHVNMGVNLVLDQGLQEKPLPAERIEESDATTLLPDVRDLSAESAANINQEMMLPDSEVKLIDSKCVPLLNSDVSTEVEAVMPESFVSGSVNISRIHHSPESTH